MKFDFFTFGGAIFWEDVFFYQKWRIQRNCFTKKYRLLDSWDIRRASGTFDTCKNAFIEYIESHEITKQKGKMVVLLHGYMDSKNIFKKLWRRFILTKSTVVALNYPSLFKSAKASAHQLLFFLNHMDDITEVSFVTKGCGNLVLQQMFNLPINYQTFLEKTRIRNIVLINPVVKENLFYEFLAKYKLFRWICGPMLQDMSKKSIESTPSIPSNIKCLKIFSESRAYRFFISLVKLTKFPLKNKNRAEKDSVTIKGTIFNPLKNDELLNYVVKFVNNGKI